MTAQYRPRADGPFPKMEGPSGVRRAVAAERAVPPTMPSPPYVEDDMEDAPWTEAAPPADHYRLIARIAEASCPILVSGPSSISRELLARAVHAQSPRRDEPFVSVRCGTIPEPLLESELFGRAHGPFGGGHPARVGQLALAGDGSLFLDEIGALSLALQIKLLRVLQVHEYSPVGDSRTHTSDARIMVANPTSLAEAVERGTFLEDLYNRISVIRLGAPPPDLAGHRALLRSSGSPLAVLPPPPRLPSSEVEPPTTLRLPEGGMDMRQAVEAFETELIRQALERTRWNKNQAADLLGVSRTTLVGMLKRKRIVPAA